MGRSEGSIAAVLPHVAELERRAYVRRNVKKTRSAATDLTIEEQARNPVIRTDERVLLHAGEIEEAAQGKELTHVGCRPV